LESAHLKRIISRPEFPYVCLGLAILIGAFLRLYRLTELMPFAGDSGRDLIIVRNMLLKKEFPLLGPPTSLTWFYLGPLTYYLWAPALFLGNFHPASVAVMVALFDLGTIFLLFLLAKEFFNEKTALLASLLYALSPFAITQSRIPLHVFLAPFFTVLFFLSLHRFLKEEKNRYFFLCLLLLGVLVQIHLVTGLLFLIFAIFVVRKLNRRRLLGGGLIFLLPLVPFLIADFQNKFSMTGRIIVWVPYRILSTFGLFTLKNMISLERIRFVVEAIVGFLEKTIMLGFTKVALFLFAISLYFLWRKTKRERSIGGWLVLVTLLVAGLAFFLHGQPAAHYFTFLTPLVVLVVAFFLDFLIENKRLLPLGALLISVLLVVNIVSLLKAEYLVEMPLKEQVEITRFILNDAQGKRYEIFPPPDIVGLPEYYKNYEYLGWWLGNEPVNGKGEVIYTIYHRKTNLAPLAPGDESREFSNSIVVKSPQRQ